MPKGIPKGFPAKPSIPVGEIRAHLNVARKMVPIGQIAKRVNTFKCHLLQFAANRPQYYNNRLGPRRLQRLLKICLDVETGALRWNGQNREKSRVFEAEPCRPATVIHRVMFDGVKPVLRQGSAPQNDTMPSFAKLFGEKPAIQLPKLFKASK